VKSERLHIPLRTPVTSLCWFGDELVDWVGGVVVIGLDGKATDPRVHWGYRFDAAAQSASGRYAVIYQRLGTKALVLDRGKLIRELNRSFYHANAYEYPIALFEHVDGRTLIAHCPDDYNRIEIDDVATGARLTSPSERKPADFFHSRLSVSPRNSRLLSAGWIWHPVDSVSTWSIADALADGRVLDTVGSPHGVAQGPMSSAAFIDEDRIVVSSNSEDEDFGFDDEPSFRPGSLGVFNLKSGAFENIAKAEEKVGTMLWLGDGLVVGFFECPKVFDVATGRIVHRWTEIATGKQDSSIIHRVGPLPAIACDPIRKRFAIGSKDGIEVISL
jgi:hypothetical protein